MTVSTGSSKPTAQPERCLWCGKPLKGSSFKFMFVVDDSLCEQCRQNMDGRIRKGKVKGLPFMGLYVYQSAAREMIIQYKELKDEALFEVFLKPYVRKLKKKFRNHIIVPVPSSRQADEARGFRAVSRMFSLMGLPERDVLIKTEDVLQKEKGLHEREEISRYINIKKDVEISGKACLLVDDIITTGATIKACYSLLKPHFSRVDILCICYSPRLLNR